MISTTKRFFTSPVEKKLSEIDDREHMAGIPTDKPGDFVPEKITTPALTFDQMQSIYEVHVWVRVCIDAIISRATSLTPLIKPIQFKQDATGKFTDNLKRDMDTLAAVVNTPNSNQETFADVKRQVFLDILKFDAGAYEMTKSTSQGVEVYAVPGNTIKLNKDTKGVFKNKSRAFIQVDPKTFTETASWDINKMAYIMQHPQSDRVYGLSPIETLTSTVTADLYAESFNMDFFTNQATPRFAVLYEGLAQGQSDDHMVRFRKWWDRELKGKYHRPILLTTEGQGKIEFQKVGLTNEEMQFQQYSRWLLQKVMALFKIQPIVIGLIDENMGKMNSEEQVRIFKAMAIMPLITDWAEKFNYKTVWNPKALGLNTVYLDYDLDLVDKKEQAEWHQIYQQNGVLTINEIRVKGLGLAPVPWGNVPYLQNNLVPFGDGAVPATPQGETPIVQAPEETTMAPTAIAAKMMQGQYLSRAQWMATTMAKGDMPIGWENMEPGERFQVIEQLILNREKYLSKVYSIPEKCEH